jgi:hypothetical protein
VVEQLLEVCLERSPHLTLERIWNDFACPPVARQTNVAGRGHGGSSNCPAFSNTQGVTAARQASAGPDISGC